MVSRLQELLLRQGETIERLKNYLEKDSKTSSTYPKIGKDKDYLISLLQEDVDKLRQLTGIQFNEWCL